MVVKIPDYENQKKVTSDFSHIILICVRIIQCEDV